MSKINSTNTSILVNVIPLKNGNGTISAGYDIDKQEYYVKIDQTNLLNIYNLTYKPLGHRSSGNELKVNMSSGFYLVKYNWDMPDSTNENNYIQIEFNYSGNGEFVLDSKTSVEKGKLYQRKLLVNENGVIIKIDFRDPDLPVINNGNVFALYKRNF